MAVDANAIVLLMLVLLPMVFLGATLLTWIASAAKSVKEAQSYTSVLVLLPMIPTMILMISPVKNPLWMLAVPFLAQNQMLLKVISSEAITAQQWTVYLRSEEHTSELQSLMHISYAVF